ncbi:hypothetical protein H9L10_14100 [Phycicoccus endophyticus]|uniref:Uncharacterized protein n=1 Tax=Phycicoccus endophyticus TaxID=1690220 RepID=A0A7G9R144_9MICO|nr:hypothetical protein [Phycicoccus endophyticus]NHI20552.1 hypothetical protein [Phycicoccus endophyticus]QNN49319.1 hypothetical protein H9L10_14100 [Phycicoccus endophyticus]GGL45153.1 hypothetical protein GCM10012283_29690 [Phycicoccus endophyticus]
MSLTRWRGLPVRLLLAAGFAAACWVLLSPSAHAEDRPVAHLLDRVASSADAVVPGATSDDAESAAPVRETVERASSAGREAVSRTATRVNHTTQQAARAVTTTVERTTDTVAAAAPAASPVLDRVDGLAADATGVVETTTERVTSTVTDTVDRALDSGRGGVPADPVAPPSAPSGPTTGSPAPGVAEKPGTATRAATADAGSAAAQLRARQLADRRAARVEDATATSGPAVGATVAPASVLTETATMLVAALPTIPRAPEPLHPLPYLVSAAFAGALAFFGGRGDRAGSTVGVLPARAALPSAAAEAVRAFLRGPARAPALAPGTSPD